MRALMLGDMLCIVPALRALRRACPEARTTLIGLAWTREFADRYAAYIDEFLPWPGYPGLPEQAFNAAQCVRFFREAQQRRFDIALQMHGSGGLLNPAVMLIGAARCAGFCEPHGYCPDAELFLPFDPQEHEVRRYMRLMQHLGVPSAGDELEFPLREDDYRQSAQLQTVHGLAAGNYVCIHPGARFRSRRWPVEHFAEAANVLGREGLKIVITGSSGEASLADRLANQLSVPHANLAGRTTLGCLAALLEQSRLVISNDTGISHVAAAVRTPSVVVVLGSDPVRWAPLDGRRHRIVLREVPCRPCLHEVCPLEGFPCAAGVLPGDVLRAARQLLEEFPAAARRRERSSAANEQPSDSTKEERLVCAGCES